MSTETRQSVESIIESFAREIALNEALAADSKARFPWRTRDAAIYKERAEVAYQAAMHLVGEL